MQRYETSGNRLREDSAYLCGFWTCRQRLETLRPGLKIMVSPVRVRVPPLLFLGFCRENTTHKKCPSYSMERFDSSLTVICRRRTLFGADASHSLILL